MNATKIFGITKDIYEEVWKEKITDREFEFLMEHISDQDNIWETIYDMVKTELEYCREDYKEDMEEKE